MKYRKKPIVIEAFQMTSEASRSMRGWPEWLFSAWLKRASEVGSFFHCPSPPFDLFLQTLEGRMKVDEGDFIIQGVKGELYPCKPDIFQATYEEVV